MNLNKIFLLGRLTRDPELRQTPAGQSVCTFSIATNRTWMDQGQKQEKVEFHNIVAWGKLAEICHQYLTKGRLVLIEGRIETRNWQDKTHPEIKHYKTDIVAEGMQMGPKSAGGGEGGSDFQGGERAPRAPSAAKSKEDQPMETVQYPGEDDIKPEDIQF
ncbi:MAG: single-stranded DNA-binding protein [Patescibacteria group bacterium]